MCLFLLSSLTFEQGNADVTDVKTRQSAEGSWSFNVTLNHPDTGWEDYADGWDVVLPSGEAIKPSGGEFTRTLWHPHVGEQPFTRGQNGIMIPEGVSQVTVRADDLKDGFGGKEITVQLA
ncbi:MAG: hypothetical protein ACI9J2_001110 [Saprospiraceae bacterium]